MQVKTKNEGKNHKRRRKEKESHLFFVHNHEHDHGFQVHRRSSAEILVQRCTLIDFNGGGRLCAGSAGSDLQAGGGEGRRGSSKCVIACLGLNSKSLCDTVYCASVKPAWLVAWLRDKSESVANHGVCVLEISEWLQRRFY